LIYTCSYCIYTFKPGLEKEGIKYNLFAAVTLGSPHFAGNSYLVVEKAARVARHGDGGLQDGVDISFLYLNFSTAELNGMIMWSAKVNF
jgi:hypothetical protein